MKKNKYAYRVGWSEEDKAYIARCIEFPSLAAHGSSEETALKEIKTVVDDVLEELEKSHEPIPEPLGLRKFGGQIPFRIPPEVHRKLAIEAEEQGVSLNQYLLAKVLR
jgi:predicted HicB family RNase H-like nuclease